MSLELNNPNLFWRWQKDVLSLLQNQQKEMEKQTSLLKLIARASGAEVEDWKPEPENLLKQRRVPITY